MKHICEEQAQRGLDHEGQKFIHNMTVLLGGGERQGLARGAVP